MKRGKVGNKLILIKELERGVSSVSMAEYKIDKSYCQYNFDEKVLDSLISESFENVSSIDDTFLSIRKMVLDKGISDLSGCHISVKEYSVLFNTRVSIKSALAYFSDYGIDSYPNYYVIRYA